MQLHFFSLSVLRLQGAAAQEVDPVREAQLPALCVGFKVHHQGLKGSETVSDPWGEMKGLKKQKCQDTHREHLKNPPGAEHIRNPHLREYNITQLWFNQNKV